jgi:flagellar secretion chaperone FliS
MYSRLAHKQYSNVHVSTVDKGRLLLMLFDGCLKFLKHAKIGLESKDISKFAKYLSKSQAIISELMLTLDFEKGGEIAKELDTLYDFMLFYLTEANIEKNASKIQKVIDLLATITSAYREVIEGEAKVSSDSTNLSPETSAEEKISVLFKQGSLNVAL